MMDRLAKSVVKDVPLDHTKVSTLKMFLFAHVPRKCRDRLKDSKISCCHRGDEYMLFEDAIHKFESEIDIVRLIRDQRWMMTAVKEMIAEKGAQFRKDVH